MPAETFCFVQAADLHLEQPPYGLGEVPDDWRATLLDAPFQAAQRVFDIAIAEDADFLVLSGDVLHPLEAGPRALAFLLDQFQRLNKHEIAVYWAGGGVDSPDRWPAALPLPENVHVFSAGRVEEVTHCRDDRPLAIVAGISRGEREPIRASDFRFDSKGLFTVAVAHGQCDAESLSSRPIHYWALGGRHQRKVIFSSPNTAIYGGTTQGRCPAETGAHGCTVVRVDQDRNVRTQLAPTDVLRWHEEQVTIADHASAEAIQRVLGERMLNLLVESADRSLLVSWKLRVADKSGLHARRTHLAERLQQWLRREYGGGEPAAWTTRVEVGPPSQVPAAAFEEDTILGDFLRAVREQQTDQEHLLNLKDCLPPGADADSLAELLTSVDADQRDEMLREAMWLGVDLLSGDEAA